MKLSLHEWRALRPAAIFFGVTTLLAGLAVGYAGQKATGAFRALELQNDRLHQAQQAYLAAVSEREVIAKYLSPFRRLVQQGFVGEERRIEWVEELHDISRQHNLLGVNYEFDAQQLIKAPMGMNPDIFLAHRSAMRIDLSLLHEVDLLILLNALGASHQASFMVRSCEIKPVAGAEKIRFIPQLMAHCEIDWLTIARPKKSAGKL